MPAWKWSKTASSNATADSTINWAEGMAPSAVNDSARAEMAAIAKWRDDISGTITTAGSSSAYTVATNSVFDSLANMNGAMIAFVPHATNGAAPTLSVDGLTARAINVSTGVAVSTGTLIAGTPYVATYNNAASEFILHGAITPTSTGVTAVSTDAGAAAGPILDLHRDSASPAGADFIGSIDFNGEDSASNKTLMARLVAQITDPTNGSEDAIVLLQAIIAGTLTTILQTSATGVSVTGALTASNGLTVSGGSVSLPTASIDTAEITDAAVTLAKLDPTAKAFQAQLLHVRDEKAIGTAGGTFTSGADRTRTLNTVKTNEISGATLSANQLSLPAGSYYIDATAPARQVDEHVAWLFNVTDTSDVVIGTPALASAANSGWSVSFVKGRFTCSGTKTLELRHRGSTTRSTDGFGNGTNIKTEVYAEVMIWKIG